jgi:hypothetical protein
MSPRLATSTHLTEYQLQNRYVGDVGDFAKYGLLRLLTQGTGMSLGVLWWLFADETHNADGRHISYLKNQAFGTLDTELHLTLAGLVANGRRSVRAVAKSGILPPDTVFFDLPVARASDRSASRLIRRSRREAWLRRAVAATVGCDVVFFDPDNGLETASVAPHTPKSGKYVFWEELLPFWRRGQSLVIYHHLNRTASVSKQAAILKEKFATNFEDAGSIKHFLFRRGSCRHFWLVAQKKHEVQSHTLIERVAQSAWREYFEVG